MSDTNDPFFIGYLPVPAALKPFVKVLIALGVCGAIAMAFVLASGQQSPGPGVWDTSKVATIEGHLSVDPYPVVYVDDPNTGYGVRAVLLVSAMKFGARDRTAAMDGQRVRVQGNFISREGREIFEIIDGEDDIVVASEGSAEPKVEALGEHRLKGEITDAKCFLGVMKPGYGKTHRACAVRCIAGGIPPLFVTRNADGEETVFVLTNSSHGEINEAVLPYVSEPVEVQGSLERRGDMLVYAIDSDQIVRQ